MFNRFSVLDVSNCRTPQETGSSGLTTAVTADNFGSLATFDRHDPVSWHSTLRASALPVDPGNSLATAYDLGTINTNPIYVSDFVGNSDRTDYYRLSLSMAGSFSLTLTNLSADADVRLLDAQGREIASAAAAGNASETINRSLAAGTYYIQVYQYRGDTNYSLSVAAPQQPPRPGFNPNYGYGEVNAATAVAQAIGQPTFTPVPNLGGNHWGADTVNAPEVWARSYTGQGTVVAVIDSGVDYTHPDLDNNLWSNGNEIAGNSIDDDLNGYIDDVRGWDFVDRDNTPLDLDAHGTHVAGTIAAERNEFGVTGIAYNSRIMPVRVLDAQGYGTSSNIAAGIRYAADNGADVLNLSLGGGYATDIVQAIEYAVQRNVVVVMAAGNESASQPSYPAGLANQWGIAVGAVDQNHQLAFFSNRAGTSPLNFVVAPGINVYSTTPGNTYSSFDGTSMAAPHVAGIAALMLSANPNLTAAQVTNLLTATANPNGIIV
jgi:subtilisin family serine protease